MQSEKTYLFLDHIDTSASYIQFNSPSMRANTVSVEEPGWVIILENIKNTKPILPVSYIKNFLLSSQRFGARLKYVKCWGPEFKLGDLIFPYTVLKKNPSSSKKSNLACSSWSEFSRENSFVFYIKPMNCMQYLACSINICYLHNFNCCCIVLASSITTL